MENKANTNILILKQFFRENNIRISSAMQKGWCDKTPVGFNCLAPSLLRTPHSIEKT